MHWRNRHQEDQVQTSSSLRYSHLKLQSDSEQTKWTTEVPGKRAARCSITRTWGIPDLMTSSARRNEKVEVEKKATEGNSEAGMGSEFESTMVIGERVATR
ncbi:hypothetical protein SERLA73DRAFT_182459 [Serpula lacrymans var. lacrymans S7.3]|uniref:Uncharacterized protein n=1 Tax=Serpula lacrymans var. lacrymans (strain S7.3) TaxID=936435 RepID=F8PXG6_SERL3|nr:hypothetical protein SERLA73DRAFT_182459 [Serpula lacrymans var. lacrymans S7.3]